MNPFETLLIDVITHYRSRLKVYAVASNRMQLLTDMTNEIIQLKKAFLEVYPQQEQVFDSFVDNTFKQLNN